MSDDPDDSEIHSDDVVRVYIRHCIPLSWLVDVAIHNHLGWFCVRGSDEAVLAKVHLDVRVLLPVKQKLLKVLNKDRRIDFAFVELDCQSETKHTHVFAKNITAFNSMCH
nr:MAG TPA: hypothetical protein [Caudoviricetes sp.]